MSCVIKNDHGYKPQSKLWKQIPQKDARYYTLPMQDNSANKLQYASLLELEFHNKKISADND